MANFFNDKTLTEGDSSLMFQALKDAKTKAVADAAYAKTERLGYAPDANSMSAKQLQQALSDAVDQQIYTADDGTLYQEKYTKDIRGNTVITKVPYQGVTRDLYIDNTKQGNMKLGLARTDKGGFTGRYDPSLGGWSPGPQGVTTDDGALMNITMPHNKATMLEYNVHSNIGQMRNRAIGQGPVSKQDIANFGSGKTEYTTQNAPMWNQNYRDPGTALAAGTPMPKSATLQVPKGSVIQPEINDQNTLQKAGTAAASGAFNLVSRGMQTYMHGLEGVGEAIGSERLARGARVMQKRLDQQRKDGTYDKYLGYSPAQVEEYGKKFSNSVQKGEYWEALKGIASDPESAFIAFAQSAPEMAAMMTPLGLGAVVGINVNNNLYSLEQSAAAQGRATTATEKGTSVGLSVVSTLLDRLGDKLMMGNKVMPGKVTDAITTALTKMTPTIRNEVVAQLGGRLAKAGVATASFTGRTAVEGITEGIQTIGENKATDVNKMNMNLSQEEIDQALQATGVGLGAGAVGTAGFNPNLPYTAIKETLGAAKDVTNLGLNKLSTISTGKTVESINTAKAEREAFTADINAKRVSITEDMSAEDVTIAEDINAHLDSISDLDRNSPTYKEDVQTILNEAQEWRQDLSTAADTEVQPTTTTAEETSIAQESKVQVEEDTQLDEVQQERLHKAGMSKITTLNDRTSKVKVSPIEGTRVSETSKKKGKLFDPMSTTDEKINEVVAEGYDKDNKDTTFMKRIAKKLGYGKQEHTQIQNLAKEIEGKLDVAQEAMSNILPDGETATVANVMRAVAIGMSNIRSGQTAEYDISNKYGMEHKTSGARKLQLVNQIGQAYTNAFGFKLTGTAEDVAKAYAERGEHIIKLMQDLGMVTETEENLPVHNIVESDPMNPAMRYADKKKRTAMMKVLTLTSNESTGSRKNKNRLADAVSTFSKLFTPPNVEIPATEGQTAVVMSKGAEDVKISKEHQDIIKQYSELKYKIKPEAMSILKDLKKLYDKHDQDIDKLIAEERDVVEALQLVDGNSALTKMSEVGRKINRTGNLAAVLESLDEIEAMMSEEGGFNYHYESAINERIHVLQTVLEFQGDKYMARQMVTGGEYTTANADAFNILVANVADEMGISEDEVKNPTGKLGKVIENIKGKNGTVSLADLVYLSGKFDVGSPFKLLSLLRAVHDISKADGYKVTTSYMVESDATASGVVNTLLNISGFESIQKILGKLGIGKYAIEGQVQDPYNILSDVAVANDTMRYNEEVKPIVDRLTTVMSNGKEGGANKFLRELVKYAMMPWFYGQKGDNTGHSMGNSIAVDMVKSAINGNAAALKWVNEILNTEYTTTDTAKISSVTGKLQPMIKEVSQKDIETLSKFFGDTVGDHYVRTLEDTFSDVKEYRKMMNDMYTLLDKSGKWEGTIKSAMGTELGTNEKMSIQKLKSMTLKDIDKELLVVNKMLNNKTSFNVNLQHATDAALLLLTLRDVMASKGNTDGIMTVHDALYSDANTAKSIMKAYNKYTVQLAKDYDYLTAALNEVEEVYKDNTSKAIAKQIQTLKDKITELKKNKVEFLSPVKTNILGQKDAVDLWGTETEVEPDAVKETIATAEAVSVSIKAAIKMLTEASPKGLASTIESVLSKLNIPESHKELYAKVIDALRDPTMTFKVGNEYMALSKQVTIDTSNTAGKDIRHGVTHTIESLIETLAHEVDHAYQLDYIENNKDSVEVKYMQKVLDKLSNLPLTEKMRLNEFSNSDRTIPRLDYATQEAPAENRLAELIAILTSEPDVAIEIQRIASASNLMTMVERFISKVKAYVTMLLNKDPKRVESILQKGLSTDVSVMNIQMALAALDHNARANAISLKANPNTKTKPAKAGNDKDHNGGIMMAPYNAVNDTISKSNSFMSDWMVIWGDTMVEHMGPPLKKAHVNMKRNSELYKTAVSMLRNGFYSGDFAQRMHYILGLAGDVKDKVVKEALKLSNQYQQESVKELENMAKLDRLLKDTYSKADQKKIHRIFADTGIANLVLNETMFNNILEGKITIKEAMVEVSSKMTAENIAKLDDVANYWTTGETATNNTNVYATGIFSKEALLYTTLKAMSTIPGSQKLLQDMDKDTRNWMMSLALINKKMNDELNEKGVDYRGMNYSEDAGYHGMYDGSYSMDIHDKVFEYKAVTLSEMRRSDNSSENGWIVVKEATKDTVGILARENYEAGYTTGVGLELNRYSNGALLSREQSKPIVDKLRTLNSDEARESWLFHNGMVQEGSRFRVLLSKEMKTEKLHMVENAAHSLYRTYLHNKDLIASEAVRRTLLENGTRTINSENGMKELERILKDNDRVGLKGERVEVEPFINIDYTAPSLKHIKSFDDLKKEYPMIAQYYRTPEGLTTFNNFNKKVSLVKRGVSEVLLGYKNGQIFGNDNRDAARWESMFKKMVILAKQKMVVMNPVKLLNDTVTNMGVLSMMDMTPTEIYYGMKDGYRAYGEYSKARGKLVELQMAARMADATYEMNKTKENETAKKKAVSVLDKHIADMKEMDFHEAYNAGFVQSYSTDLVIKEFDTISGIQKDIDDVIDKYTHDKKGNPNKLFDAIKWFANTGPQMDEWLIAAGTSAKMKGTDVGTELVEIAERLKNKKNDKESVSRYVSEFLGSPASEAAAYGSAYMVLGDVMAKYTLAKHLIGKENPRSGTRGNRRKYTSEEAYALANDTFIDYRANLPKEIKVLSDYGILMFPAYWLRVQKVIAGLLRYHPVSALGSYAVETAMGVENLNVLNQNIVTKAGGYYGVLHSPTEVVSWHSVVFGFGAV